MMRNCKFSTNFFQGTKNSNFTTVRSFSSTKATFANKCLVFAEHGFGEVHPSALSAVTAASKISDDVNLVLVGENCTEAAKNAANIKGVKKVYFKNCLGLSNYLPEKVAPFLSGLQKKHEFTHIIAANTSNAKNILPRVAALEDKAPISDVIKIVSEDTFVRPIYAGSAQAVVQSTENLKIMTIRATGFDKAEVGGGAAVVEEVADIGATAPSENDKSIFVASYVSSDKKVDLTDASIVISGGRGMKNGENFKILYELAQCFDSAAVGATRGAVDANFCSNDLQVGQTGKIVAPDLYIAAGISGAIQHLAGMKDSKVIVAINTNEDAAIFQVADYGVVGDLFTVVPELTKIVKEKKGLN